MRIYKLTILPYSRRDTKNNGISCQEVSRNKIRKKMMFRNKKTFSYVPKEFPSSKVLQKKTCNSRKFGGCKKCDRRDQA